MTYKLNPEIRKITSLVELVFPDGEKRQFENGAEACSVVFESRYVVKEIKAVDATVEIYLQYVKEDMDWVNAQAGGEPNLFDGV
jgi:hypothetical protein